MGPLNQIIKTIHLMGSVLLLILAVQKIWCCVERWLVIGNCQFTWWNKFSKLWHLTSCGVQTINFDKMFAPLVKYGIFEMCPFIDAIKHAHLSIALYINISILSAGGTCRKTCTCRNLDQVSEILLWIKVSVHH